MLCTEEIRIIKFTTIKTTVMNHNYIRLTKFILIFFVFLLDSANIIAQNEQPEIITPTLHPNTISFANEVYRDCMEYTTAEFLSIYSQNISQVEIIKISLKDGKNLPLLSGISLKNKCNLELKRDETNFDKDNFNPLKYFFNFYSSEEQFIRVDNTHFVIHILPGK